MGLVMDYVAYMYALDLANIVWRKMQTGFFKSY